MEMIQDFVCTNCLKMKAEVRSKPNFVCFNSKLIRAIINLNRLVS